MPIPPRLPDPNAAAHERLYRTLRQQVMHGELPPGQALTLRGLARQFGVSMTPAREAVRRLVAEGAFTLSTSGRVSTPGSRMSTGQSLVLSRSSSAWSRPAKKRSTRWNGGLPTSCCAAP